VSILGRHEHRLFGREAFEVGDQHLKRLHLLLFRCELEGRRKVVSRDRQLLSDQRNCRVWIGHGQDKQCLQLGQFHFRCIFVRETGGPAQLVQYWE
jgi:hypothetical protein